MSGNEGGGRLDCLGCKDSLRGITSPMCPECGRTFTFSDRRSFGISLSTAVTLQTATSAFEATLIADRILSERIPVLVDGLNVNVDVDDVERAHAVRTEPEDAPHCSFCQREMVPGFVWLTGRGGPGSSMLAWSTGVPRRSATTRYLAEHIEMGSAPRRAHRCEECHRIMLEPRSAME